MLSSGTDSARAEMVFVEPDDFDVGDDLTNAFHGVSDRWFPRFAWKLTQLLTSGDRAANPQGGTFYRMITPFKAF